ncbi:MAG: Sir2 family NAD-dependent protein deacetylase [Candidatus Neomarinimicrobiota bacterium]|nr:Sir2 family NAD-dependent protein deacetylase [Candidatus Neomarinimicrobiota bacterium]
MEKITVLTGAGISAESGLKTFRDSDGLWENHRIEDVATPDAWGRDPELVLKFYNERRKQVNLTQPNKAHQLLAELEKNYEVNIVTQNIDDLHEKGGSTKVHHLHGEINKARSTVDPSLIYDLNHWEMKMGDTCDNGSQLRPHIVWFGEPVPMIDRVIHFFEIADKIIVIGTSLGVYPAAGLINYTSPGIEKYYIDPMGVSNMGRDDFTVIAKKAVDGLSELVKLLNEKSGL